MYVWVFLLFFLNIVILILSACLPSHMVIILKKKCFSHLFLKISALEKQTQGVAAILQPIAIINLIDFVCIKSGF